MKDDNNDDEDEDRSVSDNEEEESDDERSPTKSRNGERVEENKSFVTQTPASSSYKKSQLSIDIDDNSMRDKDTDVTAEPTPANFSIYPSLRGRLFRENNLIRCVGEWAMTDSAHGHAGQTSEFEFKLTTTATAAASLFPVSGKYVGWFHLKQPMKPPLKIEDKELNIVFTKSTSDERNYDITGTGINKFGKFSLYGSFEISSGKLQMYRVYLPKPIKPVSGAHTPKPVKPPRTPSSTPRAGRPAQSASAGGAAAAHIAPSPREIGQRVRKPSAVLTGTFETPVSTPTSAHKRQMLEAPDPSPPASSLTQITSSGRVHRAPPFHAKCKEILKELSKHPLSVYFNDPVDPVKLNIPDYFTIVKEPMDFTTIKNHFEEHFYTSHEQYAEHMRLVFRNAIAYNVRRDNPVHIAARELSDQFEERYRVMVSQLANSMISYDEPILPPPKKSAGRGRGSKGGRGSGPREYALDASAQTVIMMQQKMIEMEAEIISLRTAVRQSDIRATLGHQIVAAQAPLTYEEKKILTNNINKLDGDHIAAVVDIIQSAMPSACSDGEEIEIPVDELDTFTLRKLQDFVQNALTAKSKKRAVPPPSPSARSSTPRANPSKKPKTSSGPTTQQQPLSGPPPIPIPAPPPFQPSTLPQSTTPSSSAPTFFSNQSYASIPAEDCEPTLSGRKRSGSLDFFPATDEADGAALPSSVENSEAWNMVAEPSTKTSSERQNSGWGDALYEKHVSESRKVTLQAEAEKSKELRTKLEEERLAALALERERSVTSNHDGTELQRRSQDLELLREKERLSREELEPTVEVSNAHSALYSTYEL